MISTSTLSIFLDFVMRPVRPPLPDKLPVENKFEKKNQLHKMQLNIL